MLVMSRITSRTTDLSESWLLPNPLPRGLCQPVQIGGRQETPAYLLNTLKPGHVIEGPAILIDDISTVVVEPKCTAHITAGQDIRIEVLTGLLPMILPLYTALSCWCWQQSVRYTSQLSSATQQVSKCAGACRDVRLKEAPDEM
jgi:hypothetical protein